MFIDFSNNKNMEYHYQLTLASSPAYKQLQTKYKAIKEAHLQQKQQKINVYQAISSDFEAKRAGIGEVCL